MSTNINFMWNVETKGLCTRLSAAILHFLPPTSGQQNKYFSIPFLLHLSNILLLNKFQLKEFQICNLKPLFLCEPSKTYKSIFVT